MSINNDSTAASNNNDDFVVTTVEEEAKKISTSPLVNQQDEAIFNEIDVLPTPEQFSKVIVLEDNLRHLQRQYDSLHAEKSILEKKFKDKEIVLAKVTVELETAEQKCEQYKDELKKKDIKIKSLSEKTKLLADMQSVGSVSASRDESLKNRSNAKPLSEDALDRITQLENEIKLKDIKIGELQAEVRTVTRQLNKKESNMENISKSMGKDNERYVLF